MVFIILVFQLKISFLANRNSLKSEKSTQIGEGLEREIIGNSLCNLSDAEFKISQLTGIIQKKIVMVKVRNKLQC